MKLKANFHMHTAEDRHHRLDYTIYEAVDYATKNNFQILNLTCHGFWACKKEYADYALSKNILLLPGIEAKIEGKHVIISNCDKESENIKTFKELADYKKTKPYILILAPHPFVSDPRQISLEEKLEENISLFDAIELTIFSNKIFNFNKKAKETAKKYGKPLLATSDTHFLKTLNRGYSMIDTEEKTPAAIFKSIREKKNRKFFKTIESAGNGCF